MATDMPDWQFACTEACRNVSVDGAVVEKKSNASAGYLRKCGPAVPLEDLSWKVEGFSLTVIRLATWTRGSQRVGASLCWESIT